MFPGYFDCFSAFLLKNLLIFGFKKATQSRIFTFFHIIVTSFSQR